MRDPLESSPSHTPASKGDLIESIYRIALEPQTYDSFMGHWDDFIQSQMQKLDHLQADMLENDARIDATEISNHFAIAMQLLEQSGRPDPQGAGSQTRHTLPQLLFSSTGALVWHNSAARKLFDIRGTVTLDHFAMTDSQRTEVRALFAGQSQTQVVLVRMKAADQDKLVPMSFRQSDASPNERLFMATELRQSWPEKTGALLATGFGLSQSETDICALLVDGHNADEIAGIRTSAVGTVRTQIKKILQKTGCSGQVDLVNLLHATMRLAEADATPAVPAVPAEKIPDRVINIQLPHRVMPVETFGDPNGTPVIFFHGMLDGNSMTRKLRNLLNENGFHLICPVRPSFGTAAADETGLVATAPQRFANDIKYLVEFMGIRQPILMGHMAGAVYAHAAAQNLGSRIRGVLSVAGAVPIVSSAQFASMSVRQRIVALTARYTPRVLPFVIRAGISQLDNAGERQFMQSLYQNSPHDLRATADPEISDIIVSGYHFTIAQGHRAFEIDSYHVVRDWSEWTAGAGYPVELLHGAEDPVVSIASVRDFQARTAPRSTLTVLLETGQLVAYANPEAVISALRRLRGDQGV